LVGKRGTKLVDVGDRRNTTVVCGQPGSGKTTYVERFKAPNDLTWDYDVVMADITGLPLHQFLPGAIGSVLAHRDAWIEAPNTAPTTAGSSFAARKLPL